MFDDPGVRSVRVAVALCERFTELTKGPTTVRSAKQRGALVGVAGDQTGLSMRIGEAQQIYPEIWQHLDAARKVFAERGVDVGAFDRIREAEGAGLGADVGMEQHSYGYGSHGVDQQVKSAGFNLQGLGRARQAIKALMDATPDIDWKAIAAAENSDPAAAEFLRAQRTKRYMRFAALALVIFLPFGIVLYMRHEKRAKMEAYRARYEQPVAKVEPLAAADRAAIEKLLRALRPQLIASLAKWPEVVDPATLGAIQPGTAPCPHVITAPAKAIAERYVREERVDPSFASSDFYGYLADKPVPNEVVDRWLRSLQLVEKHLAENTATRYDRETLEGIKSFITFVVIDKEVKAEIERGGSAITYTPGQVLARGFVFSLEDAKIVCAAALDARNTPPESSPYLDALGKDPALLHREMEIRIREALASGLRAL